MDILRYIVIPFRPDGRDFDGVDCWGLVCIFYKEEFGIELPTYQGVDWKNGAEVAACIEIEASKFQWEEIPSQDRQIGDVVVLRIRGFPWHVGIVVDGGKFLHADPCKNVCLERLESVHWKNRVLSYHRLKV